MSKVLVIVDIEIDPSKIEAYKEYIELITPYVFEYGGKYHVRGGNPQTLDGDWYSSRMVVMEYPSKDAAINWLTDEEIKSIHDMRRKNSTRCNMIICDKVE